MPPPWQEPEASAERRRLGGAGIALVVAGIIALAVLWALALNSLSGDRYGARVDLLYLPDGTVSLDVQERVLGTQAAILQSRAVLEPVAAQSGVPLGDLEGGVSVKMGLSNVLEVTVTAPNRRTARALAQAIADRYVQLANRLPNGPTMRVLSPAFSLSEPVSPRPSRVVAWGLLVVFQTAIVVALWLRRRQRRRRDE